MGNTGRPPMKALARQSDVMQPQMEKLWKR
jgi:hypothetical protein